MCLRYNAKVRGSPFHSSSFFHFLCRVILRWFVNLRRVFFSPRHVCPSTTSPTFLLHYPGLLSPLQSTQGVQKRSLLIENGGINDTNDREIFPTREIIWVCHKRRRTFSVFSVSYNMIVLWVRRKEESLSLEEQLFCFFPTPRKTSQSIHPSIYWMKSLKWLIKKGNFLTDVIAFFVFSCQ